MPFRGDSVKFEHVGWCGTMSPGLAGWRMVRSGNACYNVFPTSLALCRSCVEVPRARDRRDMSSAPDVEQNGEPSRKRSKLENGSSSPQRIAYLGPAGTYGQQVSGSAVMRVRSPLTHIATIEQSSRRSMVIIPRLRS